jgi:hypothetical protein
MQRFAECGVATGKGSDAPGCGDHVIAASSISQSDESLQLTIFYGDAWLERSNPSTAWRQEERKAETDPADYIHQPRRTAAQHRTNMNHIVTTNIDRSPRRTVSASRTN